VAVTAIASGQGRFAEVEHPTPLAFGPDGRLYVARIDGEIVAYGVERLGPGRYAPTTEEHIDAVQRILNHDDDGKPRPDLRQRLVTGSRVAGTPDRPVIYATSSDPRMGDKGETDLHIDPSSGAISRLSWDGAAWVREELATGLPRSAEDHATHGIVLHDGALFVTQGGNTNRGAPSASFANFRAVQRRLFFRMRFTRRSATPAGARKTPEA